ASPDSTQAVTLGPGLDLPPLEYITTPRRLAEVLPTLAQEPLIGLDLETVSLDPLRGRIRLVQLATLEQTVLIDAQHVPVPLLAPLFTQTQTTFAGHNLKFDLKYLVTAGLPWPERVDDTMLLSQLLGASGDTRPKGYYGLGEVVERTLGQSLDKSHQTDD